MTPFFDHDGQRLYVGDALEVLRQLPDESVQCCVTSPPYWGLRDYGTGTWEGGDVGCDHSRPPGGTGGDVKYGPNKGCAGGAATPMGQSCIRCGARRVDHQLGLEATPEEYVENMVAVFREVRRVLRNDGTFWLNIGDSYNNRTKTRTSSHQPALNDFEDDVWAERASKGGVRMTIKDNGIKEKDLIGVPWMLAFALRADGWYLRSEIVWAKGVSFCDSYSGSVMPECLDPSTQVFIRQEAWVSRVTLADVAAMEELPEILTPDGFRPIRNLWKTTKTAVAFAVSKTERVICSPDHRFPVSSDRRRERTRLERAEDIRHRGYADYLLYAPIGRLLEPSLTHLAGWSLDATLGFLIGVYAAEGCLDGDRGNRLKLTIGSHETEFAQEIRDALVLLGLSATELRESTNAISFRFSSERALRVFTSLVTGKNARTKALNIDVILNAPASFREGILRGYLAGDGSTKESGAWSASSASRRLRDDISTLASSVGIITSKGWQSVTDTRTGTTSQSHSLWSPYITRRQTKSGTEGVYQVPPRQKRRLPGEREMIDIEVEGGVFLIGDGLITHNSCRDRPTKAHEQVFLLTKSPTYFYDQDAIREEARWDKWGDQHELKYEGTDSTTGWMQPKTREELQARRSPSWEERKAAGATRGNVAPEGNVGAGTQRGVHGDGLSHDLGDANRGRNVRDVWAISPRGFDEAHFATFPPALIEPMIKAGTSEKGCCPECGAPWKRNVARESAPGEVFTGRAAPDDAFVHSGSSVDGAMVGHGGKLQKWRDEHPARTIGWEPSCGCTVAVCPACDTVLDDSTRTESMSVRAGVQAEDKELEAAEVLLPSMCERGEAKSTSEEDLRTMREGVHRPLSKNEVASEVLLADVCGEGGAQGENERSRLVSDVEGIHRNLSPDSSEREQGGLCDGAQARDGEEAGPPASRERSSSPPKRRKGRQPRRESNPDVKEGPRQDGETASVEDGGVSSLCREAQTFQCCSACGTRLEFRAHPPRPAVTLDPFAGAGTVALVSRQLGRHSIGAELNPEYAEIAGKRLRIPDVVARAAAKSAEPTQLVLGGEDAA